MAQGFINVLTGGTSGVYYPLGVAIGKIFSDKIPNVKTQVQATKASATDVRKVEMVFKQGVGYDPARLIASVKGKVGLF